MRRDGLYPSNEDAGLLSSPNSSRIWKRASAIWLAILENGHDKKDLRVLSKESLRNADDVSGIDLGRLICGQFFLGGRPNPPHIYLGVVRAVGVSAR